MSSHSVVMWSMILERSKRQTGSRRTVRLLRIRRTAAVELRISVRVLWSEVRSICDCFLRCPRSLMQTVSSSSELLTSEGWWREGRGLDEVVDGL